MRLLIKTVAVTLSSSLIITAPGLPFYAALAQPVRVNTPVNGQGGQPVNPSINGNSRVNGVVVGSNFGANGANLQRGANGQLQRVGSGVLGTEQTDVGSTGVLQEETVVPVVSGVESAVSYEETATAPLRPQVGATSPIGEDKPALRRLAKPNAVKRLAPQASVEQSYQAADADFRRIVGEKPAAVRQSKAGMPVAAPRRAVERAPFTAFSPREKVAEGRMRGRSRASGSG